jgi:hypothetical protein
MKLGGFPERIWARRWPRIAFLAAAILLLGTITRIGAPPPPAGPGSGMLTVSPIALDPTDPARRQVGSLTFLAGWRLESDDQRFGGLSALHVEGGRVIALSDVGVLTRFAVPLRAGRLPVRFDPLLEGPGPRSPKWNRDTEGMLVADGRLWVGFEHHNMVWRYDRATLRAEAHARPAPMRRWAGNGGPEALVRLADGRFLVLAEGRDNGRPDSAALLFAGDPAEPGTPLRILRYQRLPGFRVTDAALLPDGRILTLNRHFSLFGGISARLALARIAGGTIETHSIATLESPLDIDNMEALSVTREGGRTIIWIASDDNFSPLQRTLLMKFELTE